jgi:DNA-binding XRE family transcriptional regulator
VWGDLGEFVGQILRFPCQTCSSSVLVSKTSNGKSASLIIGIRHLCGTEPRCRHFFSASALTPKARAASFICSQLIDMPAQIRDDLSLSQGTTWDGLPANVIARIMPMADDLTPTGLRARLRRRTAELREAHGWTQNEMAAFLGIGVEAYKKYENRSVLPHHLVPVFCRLVGVSIDFFYTGRHGDLPTRLVIRR